MADVAQSIEHRFVVPRVAGLIPVVRPILTINQQLIIVLPDLTALSYLIIIIIDYTSGS